MKNIAYLLMLFSIVSFYACQSTDTKTKQPDKTKTQEVNKSKSNKQQVNTKKPKINKASPKTAQKKKRRKYPSLAKQQKALNLTQAQVNEIEAANDAAKKAVQIIKKRINGKITKKDNAKINVTKENRLKQKLGIQLYNKRKKYSQKSRY